MIANAENLFDVSGVVDEPVVQMHVFRGAEQSHPILRQTGDAVVALIRAQRSLQFAESWRDFRVAACGVTFLDDDNAVSLLHGVNIKPAQNGPIDIHAEEMVLQATVSLAREPLSAIAVVADVQPDDTTQLKAPTLLPCYRRCLPALEGTEHIYIPETLLLSANPNLTCVQYYDVPTLRQAYEENDADILQTVQFETPNGEDKAEWYTKLQLPIAYRAHDLIMDFMLGNFVEVRPGPTHT